MYTYVNSLKQRRIKEYPPFNGSSWSPGGSRPLSVSTEEYGRLWLASSNDIKQNLALLSQEPDPLRATLHRLRDRLQLNVVDIIGGDRISATLNTPGEYVSSMKCRDCWSGFRFKK